MDILHLQGQRLVIHVFSFRLTVL